MATPQPVTSWIKSITVDCEDALPVAAFWAAALGGELDEDSTSDKAYVEAPGWGGVNLWFQRVAEPKTAKNRLHLDLQVAGGRHVDQDEREELIEAMVDLLIEAGGTVSYRSIQAGSLDHVTMADPEGNEFCVV
jgi:hypothetical protein